MTLLINKYIIIHNNETCSNSQYSAEKKQEEEGGYMVQLLTHSDTYLCQPIIQTLCASIFTYPVHSYPTAAGTIK